MDNTDLSYIQSRFKRLLASIPEVRQNHFVELSDDEELERKINKALTDKDFKLAVSLAKQEIQKRPYSCESRLLLAYVWFYSQDYRASLEVIEQAEVFHPRDEDLLRLKASNFVKLRKYHKANELYQFLCPTDDPELLWEIGYCYLCQDRVKEAAGFFKRSLILNPALTKSLESYILCKEKLCQLHQAENFLQRITESKPLSEYGWFNYATVLMAGSKYEQAEEALRNALAISPNSVQFLSAFSSLMFFRGKYDQAWEGYEEMQNIVGKSAALLSLKAFCQQMMGNPRKALRLYRMACEEDPSFSWAWYGIGHCLNLLDKHNEAIYFLKKAISLNPNEPEFWLCLGQAEKVCDNFAAAQEALQQAILLEDENPLPWLELAALLFDANMHYEALQTALDGLEVLPQNPELHYMAGAYLYLTGKIREGSAYLQIAAAMDIDKHQVLFRYFPNLEHRLIFLKVILGVNI